MQTNRFQLVRIPQIFGASIERLEKEISALRAVTYPLDMCPNDLIDKYFELLDKRKRLRILREIKEAAENEANFQKTQNAVVVEEAEREAATSKR